MRKLKKDTDPPKVKQRRGVRKNYDNKTWTPSGLQFPTSVSSHLMRAEYIPERGWVSFPSLFQDSKPYADDQQNWIDMSETSDEDWMKIYEEAERRGEVYDFGEDKEAALAFGKGSWKDQLPEHLQDNQEYEDLELSDEEADKYRAGGYVLEELVDGGEDDMINFQGRNRPGDDFIPNQKYGGVPRFDKGGSALAQWALAQQDNWSGIKESDEKGEAILRDYNKRMGVRYNPSDAWSAITISNAVMTNMGAEDRNSARKLGFNPTKSHSGYVKDAFRTNANSEYRYNRYIAQKPGESNYNVGDILVKGRSDTKSWKYEDFAKAGSGYKSHGDIIVNKGEDANGEYVILGGGNVSDTYKNEKVYLNKIDKKGYKVKLTDTKSGIQVPQEEEVVEEQVVPAASKITPTWWEDEEEEVVQEPMEQEVYSDELPYDLFSQMSTEDQTALFGERLFDEGGIVRPAGDPWEYKKDGDKYLTRKQGNKSWITATGLPEESIKSMVFKEIPVSDRVKEANVSYQKEKRSQPETESGRRKHAWKYVEGVERPKTYKEAKMDGNLSEQDLKMIDFYTKDLGYSINWDTPISEDPYTADDNTLIPEAGKETWQFRTQGGGLYMDPLTGKPVTKNYPGAIRISKMDYQKLDDEKIATTFENIMSPTGWLKAQAEKTFGNRTEDRRTGEHLLSDVFNVTDESMGGYGKTVLDLSEDVGAGWLLSKAIPSPVTLPLMLSYLGVYGFAELGATPEKPGMRYIENQVADNWERTKNAYTDQQGEFKIDSHMKKDLNKVFGAGDAIESAGKSIQSGANWVGDKASDIADYFGFEDGGIIELNEAQAQAYAKMGYIVKEIK